jgi:hypothetical protein
VLNIYDVVRFKTTTSCRPSPKVRKRELHKHKRLTDNARASPLTGEVMTHGASLQIQKIVKDHCQRMAACLNQLEKAICSLAERDSARPIPNLQSYLADAEQRCVLGARSQCSITRAAARASTPAPRPPHDRAALRSESLALFAATALHRSYDAGR